MIEKICNYLTRKIREKMPDVDDERAEVIKYGLEIFIGEIPKAFILIIIAYILDILSLMFIGIIAIIPYKTFSGGVHLKTHIGCIVATSIFYIGNVLLSKTIIFHSEYIRYFMIIMVWVFSIWMIKLYAPADTEAVPILRKKERKIKKILSYITMTITLIIAIIIKDNIISNIFIFGIFFQTISITRFVYILSNNKYGHEEYYKNKQLEKQV